MTAWADAVARDQTGRLQAAADRLIARYLAHDAAQGDPDALKSVIAVQVAEDEAGRAAAKAVIEDTLVWSREAVGVFVGLSQFTDLLEHGNLSSEVGQRLAKAAAQVRTTLREMPNLVDRLEALGQHLADLDIDLNQDEVYRIVEDRLRQGRPELDPVAEQRLGEPATDPVDPISVPNLPLAPLALCADPVAVADRQARAIGRLDAARHQSDPDTPGVAR